jgi:hypothetical protein
MNSTDTYNLATCALARFADCFLSDTERYQGESETYQSMMTAAGKRFCRELREMYPA